MKGIKVFSVLVWLKFTPLGNKSVPLNIYTRFIAYMNVVRQEDPMNPILYLNELLVIRTSDGRKDHFCQQKWRYCT